MNDIAIICDIIEKNITGAETSIKDMQYKKYSIV